MPLVKPAALAERVVRVLADPERFAYLREAARATALAHYGKNECVAEALEWLGLDREKADKAERPSARTA